MADQTWKKAEKAGALFNMYATGLSSATNYIYAHQNLVWWLHIEGSPKPLKSALIDLIAYQKLNDPVWTISGHQSM